MITAAGAESSEENTNCYDENVFQSSTLVCAAQGGQEGKHATVLFHVLDSDALD